MNLTAAQELSCQARQICRWAKGDRTMLMAVIVALLAQLTGQTMTCSQLQTLAAQYSCLPPNLMLPAMIYLLATYNTVSPQIINGVGPPSAPASGPTIYFDNTIPGEPALWQWNGSAWVEVIA